MIVLFSKTICNTEGTTRQQQYSHGWLSISFWGNSLPLFSVVSKWKKERNIFSIIW